MEVIRILDIVTVEDNIFTINQKTGCTGPSRDTKICH